VCTYQTECVVVSGSAKGAAGWFAATDATVYFDHPVHHRRNHALMIDVLAPAIGPGARVALELDADSARELARTILSVLATAPPELLIDAGEAAST
jgi:hypothetical protein